MFSKFEGSDVISSTKYSFVFHRIDSSKAVKQYQKEVYIRNVIITHGSGGQWLTLSCKSSAMLGQ